MYGFKIGRYDETRELVIDPLLASTFVGSSGSDYGYAMTVHKSQGSEFSNICLIDSGIFKGISASKGNNDYLRWLYTGVTRSSDKLTIITDYPNA